VEKSYLRLVETVRAAVDVPLAVKVGPYFSAMASMARRLGEAGADGLVIFNRFYQPDIDLSTLEVTPNLQLSTSTELRLVLRWLAILSGRVDVDLAATTGIHVGEDAVKAVLAGANVVMMASALLRSGPGALTAVRGGLQTWLEEHDYESVAQARGSLSQRSVADPSAFERSNYMKTLTSYVPSW
jgi:dihydroorotate dehydrogenase (fumarate)